MKAEMENKETHHIIHTMKIINFMQFIIISTVPILPWITLMEILFIQIREEKVLLKAIIIWVETQEMLS